MDPKIVALGAAAARVASVAPPLAIATENHWHQRFAQLWHARNRRVRVQMRKMRRAVDPNGGW